jgi:hypothetical protein
MLRARERDHRREPDKASISFEAGFRMGNSLSREYHAFRSGKLSLFHSFTSSLVHRFHLRIISIRWRTLKP